MDNFQTFLNTCKNGQKNIAKILLGRGGIDLDRRDAEGNTALHYVCREGYRDLVVLLLDRGADPMLPNNRGETPLHAAARKGNREILACLIDAGADLNAADNEGCTPMMRLLENRRTDAALWLIDRGGRHRSHRPVGTSGVGLRHGTRTDGSGGAIEPLGRCDARCRG